jgi:ATP-dependent exoDNAse (exonuclease V) beta subunit
MDATGLEGTARTLVERALKSELMARVSRADEVYRELPFATAEMEGKIDLLFREGARWTLVDYKTDARPEAEKYRAQMQAYVAALKQVAGVTVNDVLLFFVRTGEVKPITP